MNIEIKDRLVLATKIIICSFAILLVYFIGVYARKDVPVFEIKDIYIKSTANATYLDDNMTANWNLNVYQPNDIYIKFGVNDNIHTLNQEDKLLKSVYVKNIKIVESPSLGSNIDVYSISKDSDKVFEYVEEYKVNEELQYVVVPSNADIFNLQVNNKMGQIALSFVNKNVLMHIYEDFEEVTFDGTLFKKANILLEQIRFTVSLDLVLTTLSEKEYIYNIQVQLPYGDIVESGTVITDDMSSVQITYIN